MFIVIPPYYKNGTNDGAPENYARKDGRQSKGKKEDIKTNQAKVDASLKEIRAGQELLKEKMLAKMETNQERMMDKKDSQPEKMEACLGNAVATDLEANPGEVESQAVHDEVLKEEAAMKTVIALKKRHGDRHIAIKRRG
jgi:hypothetical protein